MKLIFLTCAVCALLFSASSVSAEDMQDAKVEQTTESPIADMALVDSQDDMAVDMGMNQKLQIEAQPHTIADFIIHPLIALKPRQQEIEPNAEGKQADTSSTTPSPWQLFGFNAGQGLGSQVSSLAGSVTGWLGNRIQLPGLPSLDTPVRESSTSTTTTPRTTTPRPDVVVRVQQRQSTRKPLISINNDNRPNNNRRKKNPNRGSNNNIDDSEEYSDEDFDDDFDDDDDFEDNHRNQNNNDDDASNEDDDDDEYDDNDADHDEDDEEEEDDEPVKQQNNNRRRRPQGNNNNGNNNNKRRNNNNNNNNQRRRAQNNNQRNRNQKRRRPQDSDEVEQNDDDDNDYDQGFYYNNNQKRSQNQQNFIQRGQQSLMNQIRQFTRGQSPAEVGNAIRKSQKAGTNKKRRQQATLIINRNGQTIYVAPELLQAVESSNTKVKPSTQQYQYYQPASSSTNQNKRPVSPYPQPPLTVPLKRKGQPTQYITIPWTQLGISPPDQLVSITEGIQSQPLILNIPQSAINAMQNQRPNKRKQVITTEAVPLLAEASLMDIFKPPRIPPARTPTNAKPTKKNGLSSSPVVIASKPKPGPQRIRPGTIVEKAPADDKMEEEKDSSDSMTDSSEQFLVVGDDGEPGLGRNAYPYFNSYLDYLHNGQLAYRGGRQLTGEQQIPVQVIADEEAKVEAIVEANENTKVETKEENPEEIKVESPEEVKVESPAEVKEESPVEVKVESPVEVKVESPVEAKVESPVKA